jgi:hypothetical protein
MRALHEELGHPGRKVATHSAGERGLLFGRRFPANKLLKLAQEVCESCQTCAATKPRAGGEVRYSRIAPGTTQFNEEISVDLVQYHRSDRGHRWALTAIDTATESAAAREPSAQQQILFE